MSLVDEHKFDDRSQLAEGLALAVSGLLAGGIATSGSAVLAVSGGSTPRQFFAALSKADIDWSKVTIILVDERIVPADNDRSNAKLVRDNLLVEKAAVANFMPYSVGEATPEACAIESQKALETHINHIDALILGMGGDGHTASFFPGGDTLGQVLSINCDRLVAPMRAQGAGEPRLTLTLPAVLEARFIALHIEGAEKKQVYEDAAGGTDIYELPVRAVTQNKAQKQINLFWAP